MPTSLPNCGGTLDALTTLTCAGLYEVGGVDARIYVGNRADVASVTASTAGITAITLASGAKLVKFVGKPYVNGAGSEDGDLTANVRLATHTVNFSGNLVTQAEKTAAEKLRNSRNLFVIVELETGRFEVYGLDKNPATGSWLDARRGMMAKVNVTRSTEVNTPNSVAITFTAPDMYGLPVNFGQAATNADNITALEALC